MLPNIIILGPHRMHCIRCGLPMQMDLSGQYEYVSVCVSLLATLVEPCKNG